MASGPSLRLRGTRPHLAISPQSEAKALGTDTPFPGHSPFESLIASVPQLSPALNPNGTNCKDSSDRSDKWSIKTTALVPLPGGARAGSFSKPLKAWTSGHKRGLEEALGQAWSLS